MKINSIRYLAGSLAVLLGGNAIDSWAGTMGPAQIANPEKVYFSFFGGGGSSNHINMSQYGTAFFVEAVGGPLAVDAFGRTNSKNIGIVGGHIGYQWHDVSAQLFNSQVGLLPAFELEGYHGGRKTFMGHDISNDTARLPEHDFLVTYPMSTNVFLANAVLNLNLASYSQWHPYVGAGIGAAVVSISQADSLQTAPLEAGVNHYNGNPNDKDATFAAQTKLGLNYAFTDCLSVFAEYRWLYIANSSFTFGSTVYPAHAPTSAWNVNLGPQHYNMGVGGIRLMV